MSSSSNVVRFSFIPDPHAINKAHWQNQKECYEVSLSDTAEELTPTMTELAFKILKSQEKNPISFDEIFITPTCIEYYKKPTAADIVIINDPNPTHKLISQLFALIKPNVSDKRDLSLKIRQLHPTPKETSFPILHYSPRSTLLEPNENKQGHAEGSPNHGRVLKERKPKLEKQVEVATDAVSSVDTHARRASLAIDIGACHIAKEKGSPSPSPLDSIAAEFLAKRAESSTPES